MIDVETEGYRATRFIGLMVYRARRDVDEVAPDIRGTAVSWLSNQDEGLSSLTTACRHLAQCCKRLSDQARASMAQQLALESPAESLQDPVTWQQVCRDADKDDMAILEVIEQVASITYPGAAPENDAQDYAPLSHGDPGMGPGR